MRKLHIISKDFSIYEAQEGLHTKVNKDPIFCLLLAEIIIDTLLLGNGANPKDVKGIRGVLKTFMKMNESGRRMSIGMLADAYTLSNNEEESKHMLDAMAEEALEHVGR